PDGRVVGVMTDEATIPPDAPAPGGPTGVSAPPQRRGLRGVLRRWKDGLLRRLNVENYLLPYDENLRPPPTPEALRTMHAFAIPRCHGASMTFRRQIVEREQFEEILDAYAYLEDCDFSYRTSRHGLLMVAQDARLCHVRDPGGRLSSSTLATLGALNALVLH